MQAWGIFFSSFVIGFSGAMMPGPMLGIVIDGSFKKGWIAGPLSVLGHGILEIILIMIMILGFKDFFSNPMVSGFIGLFGGIFLAYMGFGMIKSSINKTISLKSHDKSDETEMKNLVLAGAVVSATNPYFVLWWASTGIELIRQSYVLGLMGVVIFFLGHILSDFVWFSTISITFSKGKKFIGDNAYRWIILILGIFIMIFSIYFISSGWRLIV